MKKWKTQFDRDSGKGTKFEKAYFLRKGQKEDIQEFINSQNEDIEIYPTMEKYNGLIPNAATEKKPLLTVDGQKRSKDEILNPVINKKAAAEIFKKMRISKPKNDENLKKTKKVEKDKKEEKDDAKDSI